ncbi:cytochrome-c peroxidase [bacterium SCSIO 12643]|nr:cytochrome-c peroxidase [bacterium SCSIO 12643]
MKCDLKLRNRKWIFLVFILGFSACKKDVEPTNTLTQYQKDNQMLSEYLNLPSSPYNYQGITLPGYLGNTNILIHDNTPADNPVTDEGATLGRVLFYDKKLSRNGTISCASCHVQEFGFSDTATLSKGFEGGLTGRHSMGLSNSRFRTNGRFFWDERAETLEDQVLMPIQDAVEMGMTLTDLVNVVDQQEYYKILFKRAFGDDEVSSDRISKALAQFIRSMVSFNSKYDQGRAHHEVNEPFDNFTVQENWGKSLFNSIDKGQCGSCHSTDAMITVVSRNNGLTREPDDFGLEKTTGNPLDRGKFKAPSLRNIAVRPPYMHNGDYKSLTEVIQGYSTGINWSPTLDGHLKMPGGQTAIRYNLTQEEIEALEAFLNTLTDTEFLTNKIYSDPFK